MRKVGRADSEYWTGQSEFEAGAFNPEKEIE